MLLIILFFSLKNNNNLIKFACLASARFDKITDTPLKVSNIKHKAVVSVNNEGEAGEKSIFAIVERKRCDKNRAGHAINIFNLHAQLSTCVLKFTI